MARWRELFDPVGAQREALREENAALREALRREAIRANLAERKLEAVQDALDRAQDPEPDPPTGICEGM
jgi:hypothetical protein